MSPSVSLNFNAPLMERFFSRLFTCDAGDSLPAFIDTYFHPELETRSTTEVAKLTPDNSHLQLLS